MTAKEKAKTDELKTLKDIYDKRMDFLTIEECKSGLNIVKNSPVIKAYDKMLKAEAVKWVKNEKSLNCNQLSLETKRWMKRLDITEEDLK